jgi:N-acetylmuramoyl-L-alanine amidase
MRPVGKIVIHCSATMPSQKIGVSEIRKRHIAKGWADIGYHFVIRRDGEVEEGRNIETDGAHVFGHNKNSIGICMVGGLREGDPSIAEANYTDQQWTALRELVISLIQRFPKAQLYGHRDLSPDKNGDGKITKDEWLKECPCFDVGAWWYDK